MGGRFGSIQAGSVKRTQNGVCHVVPEFPNVSPGPMNGSILLRWASVSYIANFSLGSLDLGSGSPVSLMFGESSESGARGSANPLNDSKQQMAMGPAARTTSPDPLLTELEPCLCKVVPGHVL